MKKINELIISFLKVGTFGFGGGSAVAPLIHKEAVVKRNWITDQEFIDILALSNSLPGPIFVKMTAVIGYKIKGYFGAFIASIAVTLPSMLGLTLAMILFKNTVPTEVLNKIATPVAATIAALMFSMLLKFYRMSSKELSKSVVVVISIISFAAIYFINLHPSILILSLVLIILLSTYKRGDA